MGKYTRIDGYGISTSLSYLTLKTVISNYPSPSVPGSSRKLLYSALPRTIESEKYLIVLTIRRFAPFAYRKLFDFALTRMGICDVYEFSLSYLGSDGAAVKLRVTQQFERVSERPCAKATPMTSEARGAILRSKIATVE